MPELTRAELKQYTWHKHPTAEMWALRDGPDPDLNHRAGVSPGDWEGKVWGWSAFLPGAAARRDYSNAVRGDEYGLEAAKEAAEKAVRLMDSRLAVTGESVTLKEDV